MNKFAFALISVLSVSASYAQETVSVQLWVDNWFEFFVDGEVVKTDPVPVTTERSFNAEVFNFEAELPAQIAVHLMDYKENDTGFEYIGSRRMQMGDGGFIAEFRNEAGELIATTNDEWLCKVIHQAPLNPSCASDLDSCQANILPEPAGWTEPSFDDSDWPNAVVHSSREVRPHGGYSNYSWQSDTDFIWGEDLEIDNTLLCRFTLDES